MFVSGDKESEDVQRSMELLPIWAGLDRMGGVKVLRIGIMKLEEKLK